MLNRSYYNRSRGMSCSCAMPTEPVAPCATACDVAADACGEMVLAMAYVPVQSFNMVYETDTAFMQGTLFPELDKPLMVGGCACG